MMTMMSNSTISDNLGRSAGSALQMGSDRIMKYSLIAVGWFGMRMFRFKLPFDQPMLPAT